MNSLLGVTPGTFGSFSWMTKVHTTFATSCLSLKKTPPLCFQCSKHFSIDLPDDAGGAGATGLVTPVDADPILFRLAALMLSLVGGGGRAMAVDLPALGLGNAYTGCCCWGTCCVKDAKGDISFVWGGTTGGTDGSPNPAKGSKSGSWEFCEFQDNLWFAVGCAVDEGLSKSPRRLKTSWLPGAEDVWGGASSNKF